MAYRIEDAGEGEKPKKAQLREETTVQKNGLPEFLRPVPPARKQAERLDLQSKPAKTAKAVSGGSLQDQLDVLKNPASSQADKINAFNNIGSIFWNSGSSLAPAGVLDAYACIASFLDQRQPEAILVAALNVLASANTIPKDSSYATVMSEIVGRSLDLFEKLQSPAVKQMAINAIFVIWHDGYVPKDRQQYIASNFIGWYESFQGQDNNPKAQLAGLASCIFSSDDVPADSKSAIASKLASWLENEADPYCKWELLSRMTDALSRQDITQGAKDSIISCVIDRVETKRDWDLRGAYAAVLFPAVFSQTQPALLERLAQQACEWYESEPDLRVKGQLTSIMQGLLSVSGIGSAKDGIASKLVGWFESAENDDIRQGLAGCMGDALSGYSDNFSCITSATREKILDAVAGWIADGKYPGVQNTLLGILSGLLYQYGGSYFSNISSHPVSFDKAVSRLTAQLASYDPNSWDMTNALNWLMTFVGQGLSKATLGELSRVARGIALSGGNDVNALAGGVLARCCFEDTSLFDLAENKAIFGLDSHTANDMLAATPTWGSDPLWLMSDDMTTMYRFAKQNGVQPGQNGQSPLETLFGFSGITRFGFYSEAELQADYDHLGALTGETPCFISTTKQSWNGARFAQYLGMLPGFDKKLFQPGNETKLKEQMASASKKYGIKPDYEDASGPKWEVLGFNGHGNPYGVEMKIVPGNAGGKQAGWLRKTASGDNEFIDIADVELLRFIGAYCRKPEIIPEACSSSGLLASGENIAEVMAKNIGGRTWGASDLAGGIADIARSRGKDGRMHIDRVIMNAAGTTSYDYRELSSLQTSTWKVTTTASGTRFEWKAQNSQNTEEYEIESSTDGKYFDRVALVPKKADGSAYVYETSSKPSGKVFYRIKQRNAAVQTYVDASHNNAVLTLKDYTFAVSEAKVAEASTGVKQDEVPAVFSLSQNYPNPFNASTTIRYSIPKDEKVKIKVYDVLGREVKTLVDREMEAGEHRTTFKAEGLASGVYIYRIEAGGEQAVKKMLLVK